MNRRTLTFVVALGSLATVLDPHVGSACQCPYNRIPSGVYLGTGATCQDAIFAAEAQAYLEAAESCETVPSGGVCGDTSLVVTTPCSSKSGRDNIFYRVEGRIYYNCWACGGGGDGCRNDEDCAPFGYCYGGTCGF